MNRFARGAATILIVTSMFLGLHINIAAADVNTSTQSLYYADTTNNISLPYRLYVPSDYTADKKYALLLFLHGAGERGNNNNHVSGSPLIQHILDDPELSSECIIVAPQCENGYQWVDTPWANGSYKQDDIPISKYLSSAYNLVGELRNTYSIDSRRLYISGLSMGGYGTWDMITRYPDLFAAAIPICGAGDPTKASLIKDMPIRTYHSTGDSVVPVTGSREMVAALKALGSNATLTEYNSNAHEAWLTAYANTELYTWLFSQVKASASDSTSPSGTSNTVVSPPSSSTGSTESKPSNSTTNDSSPATGENNLLILFSTSLILSITILNISVVRRKKYKNH